jgi:preprotein translocase subunit SecD
MLWVAFVILSVILIGPNFNPNGVVISYVKKNSTLSNRVTPGTILFAINGEPATLELLEKNFTGIIELETNKGKVYVNATGPLGIVGKNVPSTNLKFGLDLEGGARVIIKPNTTENETLDRIVSVLETRVNVYGLRESSFRKMWHQNEGFVEISMAGGTKQELKELLEHQGKFEAKIPLVLKDVLILDKEYTITLRGNQVDINGKTYKVGDVFEIEDIEFRVENISNKLNLTATVFRGEDIKIVYFDPQRSRIIPTENGYRWMFQIKLSPEAARRFALVTQNLDVAVNIELNEEYLSQELYLYLDNILIDSLKIAADLKGQEIQEPSITGGALSIQEATKVKLRLQSILRSGSLPASIEIVQIEDVSPTLGMNFIKNALFAGGIAMLLIVIVISIRYRKIKISLPMLAISTSETLIILGITSLIGATIDLSAIAAMIAAIGTNINDQIIVIDQVLSKHEDDEELTLKERIKKAFFVVLGSAGILVAAMLPLVIIGFGLLRGFAITTIIAVLIGVFITRPAYSEMVKEWIRS